MAVVRNILILAVLLLSSAGIGAASGWHCGNCDSFNYGIDYCGNCGGYVVECCDYFVEETVEETYEVVECYDVVCEEVIVEEECIVEYC